MASKKERFNPEADHDTLLGSTFRKLFLMIEDGSVDRISVSDFGKLPLQLSLLIDSTWHNVNFASTFTLVVEIHKLSDELGLEGEDSAISF